MYSVNLVSVIVPVYEVEEYLEKCVESIKKQTYQNLEIILVDDGSPDNSGKMCDDIKKTDPRIKVIHQKNMGLSAARNSALDIMQGDTVTFVDSDDTIDPHMIEYLVKDMEQYNADIVECQTYDVFKNKIFIDKTIKNMKCYDTEEALLIDLSSKGGSTSACGKLYRKKIFYEYRFENRKLYEDLLAVVEILRQSERIVIDNRPLYYYFHRNNSITTKSFNEKILHHIEGANRILDIVKRDFPGAMPGALFRYGYSYISTLDRILIDNKWKDNKYLSDILHNVRKNLIKILTNPYFTMNRKLGAVIVSISPAIYRKIVLYTYNKKWN